jgi:asparagine synthetase B (glutamine-hydrolysing)
VPPPAPFEEWLRDPPEILAARVRDAFSDAIHRATRGARVVAVLLGGLDSSSTLALLCRQRDPSTIRAITVDYPGTHPDRPYAEALCRKLGVRLTVVEPRDWVRLEQFVVLDALPYGALYGGGELAAFVAARELGADVAVTAILGDAVFGGALGQIGTRLLRAAPARAIRLALTATLPDEYPALARLRRLVVGPNVRRAVPRALHARLAARRWRRAMPWTTARYQSLIRSARASAWKRYDVPDTAARTFVEWATSPLMASIVENCEVLARAAKMRWVEPLFDEQLLGLLSAIPVETLMHGNQFRGLLRLAVADVLPEPALSRHDKADMTATMDILPSHKDRAYLRDLSTGNALARAGLVDAARLRDSFERIDNKFWIWRFLAAEAFLRVYG